MKKLFCMLAVASGLVLASCGGSKQVVNEASGLNNASYKNENLEDKSRSQQLAEAKPGVRAWGEGTSINQSFAKGFAENQARAEFSRKLRTAVQTAARQSTNGALTYSSDGSKGSQGSDEGILSDQFAQTVSDGEINNTIVINSDVYRMKDNQYHVFVCVEWMGEVAELADAMTKSFERQVKQQVSDEDRAKMEVRYDDFRKSVEKQLERLQKVSLE